MGWPVRVFQNLIYLNKKVESDLGTLLTTPKSTKNVKILLFSPIGSAAAAGQQPVVVGGPGDGLHRGHVVAVGLHTGGKLHKVIQSYKVPV